MGAPALPSCAHLSSWRSILVSLHQQWRDADMQVWGSVIVSPQDCLVIKQDGPSQWAESGGPQTLLDAEETGAESKVTASVLGAANWLLLRTRVTDATFVFIFLCVWWHWLPVVHAVLCQDFSRKLYDNFPRVPKIPSWTLLLIWGKSPDYNFLHVCTEARA